GDAAALARFYVEALGLTDLYVADLDAIGGRASPDALAGALAGAAALWLDAGISSPERALRAVALGASHVIVALETLPSFATLDLMLLAGGGVRGPDDLARLDDAGCDGALIATALHDGRIGAAAIAAARGHVSFSR